MKLRLEYLMVILVPATLFGGIRLIVDLVNYPWQEVSCTIKSGNVVTPDDVHDPKLNYRAQILYSCDDPNRGIYMWEDFASESEARAFLERYKTGSTITGFRKGSEITLKRQPLWVFAIYFVPIVLLVITLRNIRARHMRQLNAQFASRHRSKPVTKSKTKLDVFGQSTATVLDTSDEWKSAFGTDALPQSTGIKPKRAQLMSIWGPLTGSIILLLLAVHFGFKAFETWKAGESAGFSVAAAPFLGLFCAKLLYRTIGQCLALLNPHPKVQLGSNSVWPGGFLDLNWSYEGKIGHARKIQFYLVGTEKIEEKQESNKTLLESKVKIGIHETNQSFEICEGRTRIKIPENTMHSFRFESMRVDWVLRVEVQIGFWTDLHEEYTILIQPVPLSG